MVNYLRKDSSVSNAGLYGLLNHDDSFGASMVESLNKNCDSAEGSTSNLFSVISPLSPYEDRVFLSRSRVCLVRQSIPAPCCFASSTFCLPTLCGITITTIVFSFSFFLFSCFFWVSMLDRSIISKRNLIYLDFSSYHHLTHQQMYVFRWNGERRNSIWKFPVSILFLFFSAWSSFRIEKLPIGFAQLLASIEYSGKYVLFLVFFCGGGPVLY